MASLADDDMPRRAFGRKTLTEGARYGAGRARSTSSTRRVANYVSGDGAAAPSVSVPHPFERFRDREWDRDELADRVADGESSGRPVSSSYAETDGKW